MSDVMPYPSTVFSSMSKAQVDGYRQAWRQHLEELLDRTRPQLIHSHHVWLMSATLLCVLEQRRDPTPVVIHSHATGLRQISLCPHLADEVVMTCRESGLKAAKSTLRSWRRGGEIGAPVTAL